MSDPARIANVLSLESARAAKTSEGKPPSLLLTPRGFTPRGITTPRGDAFLRSLPYSIAEVRSRAQAAGFEIEAVRPGERPRAAHYAWKVRLAVENEIANPAAIKTIALPAGVDEVTEAVWNGVVFLLGCKRLWSPRQGSTYSREFAGPWSGVSVDQARRAITALSRMSYLRNSGEKSGRATIWLPGGER